MNRSIKREALLDAAAIIDEPLLYGAGVVGQPVAVGARAGAGQGDSPAVHRDTRKGQAQVVPRQAADGDTARRRPQQKPLPGVVGLEAGARAGPDEPIDGIRPRC